MSNERSVPARIVNCLIKALNEDKCVRLPRFVVVVPDWDLLRYFNHNTYGIEEVVYEAINWMTKEMKKAIEDKREQLMKIKPGAVIATEPKVVWIKMLQRAMNYDKVLTVRAKYNATLEALLSEKSGHYIIDINPILRDPVYFTRNNELSEDGKVLFWKEVDECIRLFDKRKLKLMPRKDPYDPTQEKSDSAAQLHFRMPPPHQHLDSIQKANLRTSLLNRIRSKQRFTAEMATTTDTKSQRKENYTAIIQTTAGIKHQISIK